MTSIDDVLQRVARGELTPDEALALLGPGAPDTTGEAAPPDDDQPPPDPGVRFDKTPDPPPYEAPGPDVPPAYRPPPPGAAPRPEGPGRTPGSGVRIVRVRTLANALEIYADPAVAEVQVTKGSPSLRREGDAIVVAHSSDVGPGVRFSFVSTLRSIPALEERTVLRVNPELELDIDVSCTSLRLWGSEGGLRLRLAASSAKLDRVSGPMTLDCHSSSLKGSARLTGKSRLRCEASSIKLALLEGTDVKIKTTNRMGKVMVPRGKSTTAGKTHGYATVGEGTGLVVVDATMSSVILGDEW